MTSYLDDHSRFVPGSSIHHDPTAKHAIKLLEESISQYSKPEQALTDRRTHFYPARGGSSESTEFCTRSSIEHMITSVRRPPTIGKTEAFHKAYAYEAWTYPTHRAFVNHSNYERSHQGIGYLRRADVYSTSLRDTSQQIEQAAAYGQNVYDRRTSPFFWKMAYSPELLSRLEVGKTGCCSDLHHGHNRCHRVLRLDTCRSCGSCSYHQTTHANAILRCAQGKADRT